MAVQYCEVCGVLMASSSSGPGTICPSCFQSRKVIINDSGSDSTRVQFACPTCQSLLQLPPVARRTKIKCPKCQGEFALLPDGRVELAGAGSSAAIAPPKPVTKKVGAQENMLADLRPKTDLDALLERIPQKKADALPSVLQSDQYEDFKEGSSGANSAIPAGKQRERGDGYAILPESTGPSNEAPLDFAEPDEPPPPPAPKPKTGKVAPPKVVLEDDAEYEEAVEEAPKPKPRIQTARRTREQLQQAQREKEQRAIRAAEAQKYTLALLERKKQRTVATLKLVALVVVPLLIAGLFLISTTAEGGFAVHGPLGKMLGEMGDVARRGAQGLLGLFK